MELTFNKHQGLTCYSVPSAAVPGDGTGKRLSGCAFLHAVPAAGRTEQHMGCSALGLLLLFILLLERPVVAFRNSSYAPRDSAGGLLI